MIFIAETTWTRHLMSFLGWIWPGAAGSTQHLGAGSCSTRVPEKRWWINMDRAHLFLHILQATPTRETCYLLYDASPQVSGPSLASSDFCRAGQNVTGLFFCIKTASQCIRHYFLNKIIKSTFHHRDFIKVVGAWKHFSTKRYCYQVKRPRIVVLEHSFAFISCNIV